MERILPECGIGYAAGCSGLNPRRSRHGETARGKDSGIGALPSGARCSMELKLYGGSTSIVIGSVTSLSG